MTEDKAKQQFDDVQDFENPNAMYDSAIRCIDEEAGVVLYAMSLDSSHAGQGVGLSSVPLKDTDLDAQNSE